MGLSWLWQRDLVLVLVLVMVTSTAIELTGGNVCPRVENYTATFKESYVEPVVVNTFTWCFQVPPRCARSRVEMRERWRIKTETRQRKLMDCCEGYVLKANKGEAAIGEDAAAAAAATGTCEPHCEICEYGRCVAPGTCVCESGHRGDGCAYAAKAAPPRSPRLRTPDTQREAGGECEAGTWGDRCSRTCNCQPAEICNPVDGKCHCPPGWQGSGCKEKCPPGTWGIDCALPCTCDNKVNGADGSLRLSPEKLPSFCHHETGICASFEQIDPITAGISNQSGGNETDPVTFVATSKIPTSSPKLPVEPTGSPTSILYYERPDAKSQSADVELHRQDRLATEPSRTPEPEINDWNELDYHRSGASSTKTSLSETSVIPVVSQVGTTEPSSIATSTVTSIHGNYNEDHRVDRFDTKGPKVKKASTSRPIVALVHVSGNGSPGHDGPMIMTSINAEKVPTHVVPMPLDVVALIVVGSIISLGLTTLAVLAVLHIRSRLFETIRLSIYDAEKREATNGTIGRGDGEKGNAARISSMSCNRSILACEYETPRCIVPEHQTLPRPRPASSVDLMKKQESNYSNDYPNIRLFSNLQELLEAHYDRPPSTFRPAVLEIDGEHVYDEIPLQSSTTFATKRDS